MIEIAQIGCGYWGPNLLRNLSANPDCNVAMVCDQSAERQAYVKGLYPSTTVTNSPEDIFSNPDIQAVVIATPVAMHFEHAMGALEAGKHILVEKPMARTTQEVEAIAALAKEKNLIAMAGHTFLYNPAVHYLKSLVDSGELGDIRYIYCRRLNLGKIRDDVDALWNLAPHDISIIQYLLDDQMPETIQRTGMDYLQNGIDDVVFMNILYPNKVMAHVHVSWLDPAKVREIIVVGSKKMVVYDDMAESKIRIYDKGIDRIESQDMDFDHQDYFSFNHRFGDITLPRIPFVEPLKSEIGHFLNCIEGKETCRTDATHALGVVHILESASTKAGE